MRNETSCHKRMTCCQDLDSKKKPRKLIEGTQRDNPGMDRFTCNGALDIKIYLENPVERTVLVKISIAHDKKHVLYINVELPPAASDFIREHLYTAPVTLVPEVTTRWPQLTSKQVYNAWMVHSAVLWKRAQDQRESAIKLLEEMEGKGEVTSWKLDVPDGVEAFAWGMQSIGVKLRNNVMEIALDATCESQKHDKKAL